jgi:hypothetical protein
VERICKEQELLERCNGDACGCGDVDDPWVCTYLYIHSNEILHLNHICDVICEL